MPAKRKPSHDQRRPKALTQSMLLKWHSSCPLKLCPNMSQQLLVPSESNSGHAVPLPRGSTALPSANLGSKLALHRPDNDTDLVWSQGWVWWESPTLRAGPRAGFRHCVGHGPSCHAISTSHSSGTPSVALDGDYQESLFSHELFPFRW